MAKLWRPICCAGLVLAACGGNPPDVELVDVRFLGILETSPSIRGRDGGNSGKIFGRSVWFYGDTVLSSQDANGSSWRHNSMSWSEDVLASDGITGFQEQTDNAGGPREFFPLTTEEAEFNDAHAIHKENCADPCGARWALWPGAIVELAPERAAIFYSKFYAEPGSFNFERVGSGVVYWDDWSQEPYRTTPGHLDDPTLLFSAQEPAFGSAALLEGDLLYLYSCEGGLKKPCLVARVPVDDLLSRENWRYWDGATWSPELDSAQPIFNAHTIVSVHYNAGLDLYLAFYSGVFENHVYLRSAPRPEGPWSSSLRLYTTPDAGTGATSYSGLAHAEFTSEDGRLEYLTVFRETGFLEGEIHLVEVELTPTL